MKKGFFCTKFYFLYDLRISLSVHHCSLIMLGVYQLDITLIGTDYKGFVMSSTLPHKVKMQYLHFRSHAEYFLLSCLGKFLKWWADHQSSSITKGGIYHIKHMYIQPFTIVADWPEIWCLLEVSAMFYICRYCVFTW